MRSFPRCVTTAWIILLVALLLLPHTSRANAGETTVLNHTIRCAGSETGGNLPACRVVELGDTEVVHFRGPRRQAEKFLVKRLRELHGTGHPNLPFWTMGGKQFWGDVFIHGHWRIQRNVFSGHTRLLDPGDVRQAWGSYEGTRSYFEQIRLRRDIQPDTSHLVLLIHGIFRSKDSMGDLKQALQDEGYEVYGINYPSTQRSIDDHAQQLETILDRTIGVERVSFVTHSMGGLVLRKLLERDGDWRRELSVHRIVMLAPPNQGSAISGALKDAFPYWFLTGESGQELTPETVKNLPVPDAPVGIIAGTGEGAASGVLEGEDDGTVRVQSTKIEGMDDFTTVDAIHSFIMDHPHSVEATVSFLKTGSF